MAQIKLQADGLNLADTFAFSGTVTGAGGNYSVHAIEKYVEGDSYAFTATSAYNIITDQELTITPTSSNDIIFLSGNVGSQVNSTSATGQGLGIAYSTDSWSGYTVVEAQGRYRYHQGNRNASDDSYFTHSIVSTVTGLTADTTHDFRIYGMTYSTQTNCFNKANGASSSGGEHILVAIHYKYEG